MQPITRLLRQQLHQRVSYYVVDETPDTALHFFTLGPQRKYWSKERAREAFVFALRSMTSMATPDARRTNITAENSIMCTPP